jgi:hypothetical protein
VAKLTIWLCEKCTHSLIELGGNKTTTKRKVTEILNKLKIMYNGDNKVVKTAVFERVLYNMFGYRDERTVQKYLDTLAWLDKIQIINQYEFIILNNGFKNKTNIDDFKTGDNKEVL